MWYPQKLLIKNLMSHALSGYEFKNGSAVMIHGENLCDEEQESNGSGKSAILEGIAMAILGSPLRDASAKELVKEGEDSAEVEMLFFNSLTNQTMTIWRRFYTNTKSAELEISFNDKPVKDMVSVRNGNDMILEALGIAREDLLNYYLLSKEKYVPFLKMSDTKKKQMIGRFSQADLVDPVIDGIDVDITEQKDCLRTLETEIEKVKAKIEVYEQEMGSIDIKDAKRRRELRIEGLSDDIKECEQAVDDAKNDLSMADSFYEEAMTARSAFPEKDFTAEREKIDKKEKAFNEELDELKSDLGVIEKLKARIDKSLLDAVECPKCEHEFSVADEKISIEKARKKKSDVDKELKLIEQDINQVKEDIRIKVDEKRSALRSQENEQRSKIKELQNDVLDAEDTLERKKRVVTRAENTLQEKKEALQELKDTPIADSTESYKEQIAELKESLEDLENNEIGSAEHVEDLEELKATLVKFKTHLSNKAIGAIEAHSNQYLQNTGTDISMQLDGYKMTKSGKVRENISATIYRDGDEKGSLGKFSAGEKARIEIALIMAPQKLINMNCDSGGLDLLFLDEVIESVDSAGIGGIMKSLNSTGQTILVITHGTFDQTYPFIVEVVKQPEGISIIKS